MNKSKLGGKWEQRPVKLGEQYRRLFNAISVGVVIYEAVRDAQDFIIKDFNPAAEKIEKVRKESVIGRSILEIFPGVRDSGLLEIFQRVARTGKPERHGASLYKGRRRSAWVENYVYKLNSGEIVVLYEDVTVIKEMEERLKLSEGAKTTAESKYRAILDDMNESYYETDASGNFTLFNDSLCRYLGYTREEMQGMNYKSYVPKEDWHEIVRDSIEVFTSGNPIISRMLVNIRKDGQRIYVEHSLFPLRDEQGRITGLRGVGRDVTERVLAENQIIRSKNLLQSVIDASPDWIYVKDKQHRFLMVSRAVSSAFGVEPQEMIGKSDTEFFPEELCLGNPDKGIRGFHTDDDSVMQGEVIRWSDANIELKDGTHHAYDSVKTPLRDHSGAIYGVLVYRNDVTEQKNYEKELRDSYSNLQQAFLGAVDALAATSEKRDPYTAGHQRRVSQLATAIASRMELPSQQVEGIKVAALIHDIGKIGVPSDILSKPGRLSNVEFAIVRTHPEVAYDILRSIDFPWPIAIIVLQHHERLNGSGYPHGIPGERITTEAKIIAVADVVEAMASHRPYRPSAGIDAALKEVEDNKGILYDAKAVEACLELFKEGFHLS